MDENCKIKCCYLLFLNKIQLFISLQYLPFFRTNKFSLYLHYMHYIILRHAKTHSKIFFKDI